MKYNKDKRTKNLSLRDIHVGDWVQVWSDTTERYSPPLKIIQICDDGTIYLVTSDEERPTPWEENIKNVDALLVTKELLKGFGFDLEQKCCVTHTYYVLYNTKRICEFTECEYFSTITTGGLSCKFYPYFHEFIDNMSRLFPELLILQWKGIEKINYKK